MFKIFKSLFKKNKKETEIEIEIDVKENNETNKTNEKNFEALILEPEEKVEEPVVTEKSLTESEILFLKEMDGKKVNSRLSKKTEEIVADAYELRKILCSEGYLRIPSEYERIENLTVVELKDILKQNSMKVSGKKSELIQRISENLSEKELEKVLKGKIYILTDKGLDTISKLSV